MATIALNFDTNAKQTDGEMKNLSGSIKKVATGFAIAGTAVAGFVASVASMAIMSAKSRRELENMSRLAGVNTREFEKLAFATNVYGISAEQLSDISKDVTEKLGEFAAVGTGAFTDFKDVLEISDSAARSLAKELSQMSAPEALLQITSMMEESGASGAQMSFVLESLGSDLTKLLPLLKNNGKEWDSLSNRFEKATSTFQLTPKMTEDLKDLSVGFDLLSSTVSTAATFFVSNFAPAIKSAADIITESLGKDGAVKSIEDVTVSFLEFGVFALNALSPVLKVIELIFDGLNKIGTSLGVTVATVSGFTGALASGASFSEAADISSRLAEEAEQRGVVRERSIEALGQFGQGTIDNLTQTLNELKNSIQAGNASQAKTATQLNKATQNNRGKQGVNTD